MITPKKPSRCRVEVTDDFPPFAPEGWTPTVSGHGVLYYRRDSAFIVPVESWIDPSYPEQAKRLCSDLGYDMGPTPSTTAMRLLRAWLARPLGTGYSFSRYVERNGAYGGGRCEVGVYGTHSGPMTDIDFKQAYGTLLAEGPGDLTEIGCGLLMADFVEATVNDLSHYPVTRLNVRGRSVYVRRREARVMLTKAELDCTEVLKVHQTYRLERRDDVSQFAQVLLSARKTYPVAKLLLNALVGRLRIESDTMWIPSKRGRVGDVYISPGVWAHRVESKPSGALATAAWINGTCRGHLSSLLSRLHSESLTPITWDTDGVLCRGDASISEWKGFDVKQAPVEWAETFNGKANILVSPSGETSVRSGGLPGDPSPEQLRRHLGDPLRQSLTSQESSHGFKVLTRRDGSILGRRVNSDGTTVPYSAH